MAEISNEGTRLVEGEGKELSISKTTISNKISNKEAKQYADQYIKNLKERHQALADLISSGYFLLTS